MPPRPQYQMRFVLRVLKFFLARLHIDRQARLQALQAQKNRQRHHHEVVLILPEYTANLLHHPYHQQFVIPQANRLAHRVHAGK